MDTDERIPPHDESAERSIIGACLGYGQQALDEASSLQEGDFFIPAHSDAWKAIRSTERKGRSVDVVTVGDEAKELGLLASFHRFPGGWNKWATESAANAPTLTAAKSCAEIVLGKAKLRRIIRLATELESAAYGNRGAEDVMETARAGIAELEVYGTAGGPVRLGDKLGEVLEVIEDRIKTDKVHSVSTGISTVDYIIGGMMPGNLIVIGARPGVGKTAMIDGIMHILGLRNVPALLFSLEMTFQEQAERLLSLDSGIGASVMAYPKGDPRKTGADKDALDHDGWKKITQSASDLSAAPIFIDDRPLRLGQMLGEARRWKAKHVPSDGIGLIAVDYAGLVEVEPVKGETREQQVARISGSFKRLAKALKCPVALLSQLNRKCEDENRPPRMADLRESGAVEQDADKIILIHRDMRPEDPRVLLVEHDAKAIIEKNRGGKRGTARLRFIPHTMRFVGAGEEQEHPANHQDRRDDDE